ncbi:MAG: hypothetical protein L0154_06110 [Chloroflexi bacterium]|nr:hypothetical protein [Chloroflexota bacterium]
MCRWLFLLLVLVFVTPMVPKSEAQEPEADYVLYYLTRNIETSGYNFLLRSEFDAGQTPHEGFPMLDFKGANLSGLPAISPDGETILLAATPPFDYSESGYSPNQIYAVSPYGGDFRSFSNADRYFTGLEWSPDGSRIAAFTNPVTDAIGFRLEILDVEGNTVLSIDGPGSTFGLPVDWTQDGSRLAMMDSFSNGPTRLFIVDTATGEITTNETPIYAPFASTVVNWSADEQYLYFTGALEPNTSGPPDYFIIEYDVGADEATVFWDAMKIADQSTVISPDRSQLTTIVQADGGTWQLIVLDIASQEIVQQAEVWPTFEYEYGHPVWSPDSTYIAYSMQVDFEGAAQVYVLNVANGEVTQVTFNPDESAVHPQWLPQ